MKRKKRMWSAAVCMLCTAALISGCTGNSSLEATEETSEQTGSEQDHASQAVTNLDQIDSSKWQYNEEDDVYYQLGIVYCEYPADTEYEELAVIVPAAYMNATENSDGSYTCTVSEEGEINGYTASTAPVVFPVNTPGYSAQSPMTEYSSVSEYTSVLNLLKVYNILQFLFYIFALLEYHLIHMSLING